MNEPHTYGAPQVIVAVVECPGCSEGVEVEIESLHKIAGARITSHECGYGLSETALSAERLNRAIAIASQSTPGGDFQAPSFP